MTPGNNQMATEPSRIVLYDKDGRTIHDADTPERVAEVMRLLPDSDEETP